MACPGEPIETGEAYARNGRRRLHPQGPFGDSVWRYATDYRGGEYQQGGNARGSLVSVSYKAPFARYVHILRPIAWGVIIR